ncbi:MAG: hypothetical protein LW832_03055 [Parachlamydia sp.]|jgi:hypothetical protein|nr:hypothetical protein [Parachlamydia sp.]
MIDKIDIKSKTLLPIPSFLPTIVEKAEKHAKESEPILAGTLTPYEAFKEGFERAIASFIKLGNEGTVKKITSETPLKNIETELMEELIKNLLTDFNSVRFIEKNGSYFAICKGKLYHFSSLLEKTNFNLIELSPVNLAIYHSYMVQGMLYQKPVLNGKRPTSKDFIDADPEKICRTITFAEKEAINIYTGSFYSVMNNMLRGNIREAIQYFYAPLTEKEHVNHAIKEALLHIAVAVHGLNRLPDYTPPINADGQTQKYLYRSDGYLPDSVLEERKWAVLNGGEWTTETGFISSAYFKPTFFGEHVTCATLIKNLKGKKITPLSQFGEGEREVLLPPTQMQWKYKKEIITDIYKNTMHLFIAKPVTVNPPFDPAITKDTYVQTIDPKDNLFLGMDIA